MTSPTYEVYPLGLKHPGDLRLVRTDIAEALRLFEERHGKAPAVARLHPKMAHLGSNLPESVKLELNGGCLSWECQLSADAPEPAKSAGWMCRACLRDYLPESERSADARFCRSCFENLTAALKEPHNPRAWWIPKPVVENAESGNIKDAPVLAPECPQPEATTCAKTPTPDVHGGGRPRHSFGTDEIKELADQGLSGRAIAESLGIPHRTVARRVRELQGELAL